MGLLSTDEDGLNDKAKLLVDELKTVRSEIQAVKLKELTENAERFFEREEINGVLVQTGRFHGIPANMLRDIGDKAKAKQEGSVVILASLSDDESCQLIVMADDKAVNLGVNAGALVKEACVILGGKGGGRKNLAQGGGRDGAKLEEALMKIRELISK